MPNLTDDQLDFLASLFEFARTGAAGPLSEYLDQGVPVDLTNSKGDTLLILAAYYEHEDTVRALLERGADVNRINDRGQTAVVAAVFRQQGAIVRALLEAGADPTLGSQSAADVAKFFDLPAMSALLDEPRAI